MSLRPAWAVHLLPMTAPRIIQNPAELDDLVGGCFVPTMGALHEGHLSLIRAAARIGGPVITSIFVNPTQFAPSEDFDAYPRPVDRDIQVAGEAGTDAVYLPSESSLYPEGRHASVDLAARLPLPDVARLPQLEDAGRPHFFGGVCLVVARLLDQVRPSATVFGEKDWQQFQVIRAMVAGDARFAGIEVIPGPIVREPDGLAMSSRNVYIPPAHREQARGLTHALDAAKSATTPTEAEALMRATLEDHRLAVEYAVIRAPETLMPVADLSRPTRAIITARLDFDGGSVRLLDNRAMPLVG
ncbi:MAG: pantoate--beta-alanine ligase [Planctomycetota bacterium]|nr:pantoate--beta-alanine ligase [Planctomycetota bacterium]